MSDPPIPLWGIFFPDSWLWLFEKNIVIIEHPIQHFCLTPVFHFFHVPKMSFWCLKPYVNTILIGEAVSLLDISLALHSSSPALGLQTATSTPSCPWFHFFHGALFPPGFKLFSLQWTILFPPVFKSRIKTTTLRESLKALFLLRWVLYTIWGFLTLQAG